MTKAPSSLSDHSTDSLSFHDFRKEVLDDYRLAYISRQVSYAGRKEVLTGKAKFGIFGDGKEVPQIALAKAFRNGDFRAGYYRDQTLALATEMITVRQLFAQLYANPGLDAEPHSAGRQMNNHFATRNLHPDGSWKKLTAQKNSAADNSPTASQMLTALGLALASKKYRELKDTLQDERFSRNGNEVCFVTIGDASTSEGFFWEVVNAATVQQVPLAIFVWDDGYGISVPRELQTAKNSISKVLQGFSKEDELAGMEIVRLKAWDYPALVKTIKEKVEQMRKQHHPVLFHIEEVTQPQGHSTSGSHERYKSPERLQWEKDFDCITRMRKWMIDTGISSSEELDILENEAMEFVNQEKKLAWKEYHDPIVAELKEAAQLIRNLAEQSKSKDAILHISDELENTIEPVRKDIFKAIHQALVYASSEKSPARTALIKWKNEHLAVNKERYGSYLFTNTAQSPLKVPVVPVEYPEKPKILSGFQVLNACFDANFSRDPTILAFGEDVGKIGDVNQAFSGLQTKYGKERVYDTGIREASIIGEGIGLAMRGLRPIAEIQYLDYLIYGLEPLMDDLSCLSYRTKGGQKAPLIVRTRGHRLEGIWHTGSQMGLLLGSIRGMHLCVPRNMTQAAGFYNLLLRGDEPAIVIECLNGYRLKEKIPSNPGEFTVPLGVPEVLKTGKDVTLVTYGSCVRIAQEALQSLEMTGIDVELVDVQTLLPFDLPGIIGQSVRKTGRLVILDEDVPGGATAYILERVLAQQDVFRYLDAAPVCITAAEHRSAYGTDGDYFSKPNAEDVFEAVYQIMHEANPQSFPLIDGMD
jgi:pyruvate/2-oxoglutarate/acetoin dehydrogenase E1 component/TPP-dependent pyruvate/acetoin dehydrogenase alpha subunit